MGYLRRQGSLGRRQGVHNGKGMSSGTALTLTGDVTMGYLRRQGSLGRRQGVHNGQGMS